MSDENKEILSQVTRANYFQKEISKENVKDSEKFNKIEKQSKESLENLRELLDFFIKKEVEKWIKNKYAKS